MRYTLGQAAKATGKSKSTIQAAIKKGRISASQDDLGQYQIDPAELHRVYPPHRPTEPQSEQDKTARTVEYLAEIKSLQDRLQAVSELKDRIERECEDLREDRNYWRLQARALPPPKAEAPSPEPKPAESIGAISAAALPVAEASSTAPVKKSWFRRLLGK